jgi:TrmH RNA methyltransferase
VSPYRGPAPKRDARTRERERDARAVAERPRGTRESARTSARADAQTGDAYQSSPVSRRNEEQRLFGLNACLASFARRPQDLRKVWLTEQRVGVLKAVLAFCVKQRLGYRVVETEDLDKLTGTQHHEGVCLDVARRAPLSLTQLLAAQPPAPQASLLVLLDGVGNPHNVGAVLRSAANFGAGGLIVPAEAPAVLSGAACRVAEGGAEAVPLAQLARGEDALAALRAAGYAIAATVPRDGVDLYAQALPSRIALIFGAEGEGMNEALIRAADLRLTIPGSGTVESLNISASAAVLFAEWWRTARAVR